jgi:hypothetical protein
MYFIIMPKSIGGSKKYTGICCFNAEAFASHHNAVTAKFC